MKTNKIAIETYKYFSNLEGNQHIASEFALKTILNIISSYQPTRILELGLGIGSISYTVLHFARVNNYNIRYYGTESNEFCLNVLPKYLRDYLSQVQIFNSLQDISNTEKFDLVIIDGSDENIKMMELLLSKNGIIIIEGDRLPQLNSIKTIFPNSLYTRVISNYRNPKYGPFSAQSFSSGIQLLFINPSWKQKLDFWKYKFRTALNYRLRAIS
jgi:hypothetical protein